MTGNQNRSLFKRIKAILIGDARSYSDPNIFHKLSLIAFFAWVGLGSDGLTSSCYGPEEAFLTLKSHSYLAIFVALGTVLTIFIISASYSQIIELFPSGGGGYLVASKLLSPATGMVSGCALLVDYVLTITLSIASGADAIFSFLPHSWIHYKLTVAVLGVILLTWLNLRGIKESVFPLVPVFILFIITHVFIIIYSFSFHPAGISDTASKTVSDISSAHSQIGTIGIIILVLRAYSMGAGTFTGIEAVSNGIPILREPKVQTAKHTMRYMSISLSFMVLGLLVAYLLYDVKHTPGKTLNAVLFTEVLKSWEPGIGYPFLLALLVSEAVLLFVAAQTGFLDGPRILSNMALDRWVPMRFASLNDRLVTQNGILIMSITSIILLVYSKGSVGILVIFYSINVFITFTLSQLGMVRHWWIERRAVKGWQRKLSINGIGMSLAFFILCSVVILKFEEGGWLTVFITGSLVLIAILIKKHYKTTGKMLGRLNQITDIVNAELLDIDDTEKTDTFINEPEDDIVNREAKTAVLFVNGFSGTGLHTLFNVMKFFGKQFENYVFVQIGIIDTAIFKGTKELEDMQRGINRDIHKYIHYMRLKGYHATGVTATAVDLVDQAIKIAPEILKKYPNSIFFSGQLVFPRETFLTRFLHNYSSFAIQRGYYDLGIPIIILPIRIS
jgi:amino acid transporter